MKTLLIFILLFFNIVNIFGDNSTKIYEYIKEISKKSYTLNDIPKVITKKSQTTLEKVQAITYWIELNIQYDKELANCELCNNKTRDTTDTYQIVYLKRKGVCSGISNLFRYLAITNDLTTYVIGGQGVTPNGIFGHSWNIVKDVDSNTEPYLFVDATWGSKYTTYNYNIFSKNHIYEYTFLDYTKGGISFEGFFLNYVSKNDKFINSNYESANEYIKGEGFSYLSKSDRIRIDYIIKIRPMYRYITNYNKDEIYNNENSNHIPKYLSFTKKEYKKLPLNIRYNFYTNREKFALYIKDYYNNRNMKSIASFEYFSITNCNNFEFDKKVLYFIKLHKKKRIN